MVVDVLIAERNGEHTLTQQRRQLVRHLARLAPVVDPASQAREQTEAPLRRRQKQNAAVR